MVLSEREGRFFKDDVLDLYWMIGQGSGTLYDELSSLGRHTGQAWGQACEEQWQTCWDNICNRRLVDDHMWVVCQIRQNEEWRILESWWAIC